tara:strand:- start:644 stop:1336 length:693 start_codon:yes stop_codon:yes gene_type:complete
MGFFKFYQSEQEQSDIFGEHATYIKKLNKDASKEHLKLIPFAVKYCINFILRKPTKFNDGDLSDLMISIDPSQGRFLFNQIMVKKPKVVFEFGLSHGISACYIGAALKRLGHGTLYSTELESKKIIAAKNNIQRLELSKQIKILEGDVLKSVENFKHRIDFVHMDGFPNLNLSVIQKLEPFLSDNALIITDDVNLFKLEMKPYLKYMFNPQLYSSVILKNSTGMMMSVKL